MITEGVALLDRSLERTGGQADPYQLQAAIGAVHAEAASAEETDWPQIAALYERLAGLVASPVVELNWAVALGMVDGPTAALAMIEALAGRLDAYQPFHAARADLLARAGQRDAARDAYARAIELSVNPAERHFLERQRDSLGSE